jgi:ribonuclease P protein component
MTNPARRDGILRRKADFERVLFRGRRTKRGALSLYCAASESGRPRVAFVASGRFRTAVARNRVRRRLREVFRATPGGFPCGQDMILRADPGALALTFSQFRAEVLNLAAAARN